MRLIRPSAGAVTSPFGRRPAPIAGASTFHNGIDFGWGNGLRINAAAAGTVTARGVSGGWGNRIIIRHDATWSTVYAHLASFRVNLGARVTQGQDIAVMGTTGVSTGVHLHFELLRGGTPVDPAPYFTTPTTPAPTPPTPVPEEDDVTRNTGIFYDRRNNGRITTVYNIHNTVSGFEHEFSNGEGNGPLPGAYNNAVSRAYDTPAWARVTEGHARVIKAALAALRPSSAAPVALQIVSADEVAAVVAAEEAETDYE